MYMATYQPQVPRECINSSMSAAVYCQVQVVNSVAAKGRSQQPAVVSSLQDTDADGIVPEHQQVILAYQPDGSVATADEPPITLGR